MNNLNDLIAQLRNQQGQQQTPQYQPPSGGGTIGQQPTGFQGMNMSQSDNQTQANPMAALLKAGTAYNNAGAAGGLGAGLAGAGGSGGAGFGLGQPLVTGGMGGAGYAAPAAAGLAGLAPLGAMAASPVGRAVGDIGDSLGLKKTGIPDQIRAFGDFTSGDFGGAWDNLKSSIKNIFSIF